MFHAVACIGSQIGGIPELITDSVSGLLVAAGDPKALATALSVLMGDTAQRCCLGDAARTSILARGMTQQAMNAAYQSLYKNALQTK
jgi:glycosyltransferase involved in cell wall biosynthesis